MLSTIFSYTPAAAVAKSLQSCLTLCDPIDSSPPGSPVPGILQARTLEWVAISFSNAWKWKMKGKSLSCVRLLATPWTIVYQAPPSMGFSPRAPYIVTSDPLKISWQLWSVGVFLKMWAFWCLYSQRQQMRRRSGETANCIYWTTRLPGLSEEHTLPRNMRLVWGPRALRQWRKQVSSVVVNASAHLKT